MIMLPRLKRIYLSRAYVLILLLPSSDTHQDASASYSLSCSRIIIVLSHYNEIFRVLVRPYCRCAFLLTKCFTRLRVIIIIALGHQIHPHLPVFAHSSLEQEITFIYWLLAQDFDKIRGTCFFIRIKIGLQMDLV